MHKVGAWRSQYFPAGFGTEDGRASNQPLALRRPEGATVTAPAREVLTAQRGAPEPAAIDQLAKAASVLSAAGAVDELTDAIPRLALGICTAATAGLVCPGPDHPPELVANSGPRFRAAQRRLFELVLSAVAAREPRAAESSEGADAPGWLAAIPLTADPESLALVLEWRRERPVGVQWDSPSVRVFAALAGASLARARSAAALRELAARDAATVAAVRDGVVVVDRDGVASVANQAAASALGVRRDDLLGRRLAEVPGLAPFARALASPGGSRGEVVALPRGEVVVRCEAFEGGRVAILREATVERGAGGPTVGSVPRFTFEHLVGEDPAFVRVLEVARRAAQTDLPVLVSGESGTGKELLAQAIHNASARAPFPFVGINVTAIPGDLLESELFGYEGGAFTGARASGRPGKFEQAGRGTILLDEIADMPLDMQAKLLRVLQERVVQRLGGSRDIAVRARVIATSQRDLGEEVKRGNFRLDLFHRLRVVDLRLPPLRARPGDVRVLVEHHLRTHAARARRGAISIAPRVLAALEAHDWPGNVRELCNLIEGEVGLLAPGEAVLDEIPRALQPMPVHAGGSSTIHQRDDTSEVLPLAEVERRACREALAHFSGNVARAARALGMAKGTLYSKMKLYDLGTQARPTAPARGPAGNAPEP